MIVNILKFFWKSIVGLLLIIGSFFQCCAKYKIIMWIAAVIMFLLDIIKYFTAKKAMQLTNDPLQGKPRGSEPSISTPPPPMYGPSLPPIPYQSAQPYIVNPTSTPTSSKPKISVNTTTAIPIVTYSGGRNASGFESMGAFQ